MKTIKRSPTTVETSAKWVQSQAKFFNQMEFKGILEDDNIYAIDQQSFRDANNVYEDWNDRLVSRLPLQLDNTIPAIVEARASQDTTGHQYKLVEVFKVDEKYTIYAYQELLDEHKYFVYLYTPTMTHRDDILSVRTLGLRAYKLATIDHYVICFNTEGAVIFDTSLSAPVDWQSFDEYIEVPIVKRVIGNEIRKYDTYNYFAPNTYREEYIWNNTLLTILPTETDTYVLANITVTRENGQYELAYGIDNIAFATEDRFSRPTAYSYTTDNTEGDDYREISMAKGHICVAKTDYFLYSLNNGKTFSTAYYPLLQGDYKFGRISLDGRYFFVVTSTGVYRCNLGDFTWTQKFEIEAETTSAAARKITDTYIAQNIGTMTSCCFLTGDIFAFVDKQTIGSVTMYCLNIRGPGIYTGNDYTKDHMSESAGGIYKFCRFMFGYDNLNTWPYTNQNWALYDSSYTAEKRFYDDGFIALNTIVDTNNREVTICSILGMTDDVSHSRSGEPTGYWYSSLTSIRGGDMSDTTYTNLCIRTHVLQTNSSRDAAHYYVAGITADNIERNGTLSVQTRLYRTNYGGDTYAYDISTRLHMPGYEQQISSVQVITTDETISLADTYSYFYSRRLLPVELSDGNYSGGGRIYHIDRSTQAVVTQHATIATEHEVDTTNTNFVLLRVVDNQTYFIYIDPVTHMKTLCVTGLLDSDNVSLLYNNNVRAGTGMASEYTEVPNIVYSDTNMYLANGKLLQITENTVSPNDVERTQFYLPGKNNQSFIEDITALKNISTTEVAIFFVDDIKLCSKVADENLSTGYRYNYFRTKLSTGVRLGDTVMNTLEGQYTIFPTRRGLAALNYQAFMATTDQVIEYITDNVKDMWTNFYVASSTIKIIQWRNRLMLTNDTNTILIYDLTKNTWWKWTLPVTTNTLLTDQLELKLINNPYTNARSSIDIQGTLLKFEETIIVDGNITPLRYYDFSKNYMLSEWNRIDWFIISQPLHMNAPTYYKNLKQLVFQFSEVNSGDDSVSKSIIAQIKLYRKRITIREPESVDFEIEYMRTFVKRFNYWKINEVQWGLADNAGTGSPQKFELNGISIKYEIGEEVR